MATATEAGQPRARDFFKELKPLPNDLARYQYLHRLMPLLSDDDRKQARQFLAFADANLGLYRAAISDFPFASAGRADLAMPSPAQWQAVNAVDAITRLAANRRIVMVNEAHHDPHTRLLTLALLPRLRALGFTHFAAEALDKSDTELAHRGYALATSGSEYLREPLYGDIVREAIRLGFVIVPYESSDMTPQIRENSQADNLYRRVFMADPAARLFVHAGYAHIDKAPGGLGEDVRPMAMELKRLSGFDPLSINQTVFSGVDPARQSPHYRQLIAAFHPARAAVLLNRENGKPWSAYPQRNDVSVILPPTSDTPRPDWLSSDQRRHAWPIDTTLCARTRPCVIEATPPNEPDDATPADRYTLLDVRERAALYLRPGEYRVRAWGASGKTLGERRVSIGR
ncbi:hypothetical protein RHOFW104T7_10255 [Rhodanobacter thiooxydans]|uniref:Uncharacterized protein n=1 Tax=Rhodanobacter thiooxydans TaxID=416169 RepID=A0A154QIV4_9GAMM|nr:hypothetical protein [Rhodanobacter thiooxydans]EIL97439.1 hypothetical protein UUA_15146 [Rhodanobacter thiooxydans LCS2]KZC24094.1 hypothetical protein RHOFW104T7_10255 [Rhodanobacter thiooxydans]MCW0201886.1 hypothetical protein [Rhodanobacter thiooxydans]